MTKNKREELLVSIPKRIDAIKEERKDVYDKIERLQKKLAELNSEESKLKIKLDFIENDDDFK